MPQPVRAPALYVTGQFAGPADARPGPDAPRLERAGVPPVVTLRLPLPPIWEGRVEGVSAAVRRARRAYAAVLDAMQRGLGTPEQAAAYVAKLERFAADLRSETARTPLLHLARIWRTVEQAAGGAPLLPPPPAAPLTSVVVHVPAPPSRWSGNPAPLAARLEARYAWPLEWLRTRATSSTRLPAGSRTAAS